MKTIAIDVCDLLTALGPDEVGRRLGEVPGDESVSVDHAAQSATAAYDETRVQVADIKSLAQRPGPGVDASPAASTGMGHECHATAGASPEMPRPASGHSGHRDQDKHAGHSPAMFRDRFWLMSASTVVVAINAQLLKHAKL